MYAYYTRTPKHTHAHTHAHTHTHTHTHTQSVILGNDVKLEDVANKLQGFRCVVIGVCSGAV